MGSGKNSYVNPLDAIPTKWSNTLKKIRRQKQENCVSVFGHCKACQVTPMLFTVERQPKKKMVAWVLRWNIIRALNMFLKVCSYIRLHSERFENGHL